MFLFYFAILVHEASPLYCNFIAIAVLEKEKAQTNRGSFEAIIFYYAMITQPTLDKAAISLSLLCVIHCLALPALLVAFPFSFASGLEGETLHSWLLLAIIPISVAALFLGCKKHNRKLVYVLGATGLFLLLSAFFFGHDLLGESGERTLTLLGGIVIVAGHLVNLITCRKVDCECPTGSG